MLNGERSVKHGITVKNEYYHSCVFILIIPLGNVPFHIFPNIRGNNHLAVSYPGGAISA